MLEGAMMSLNEAPLPEKNDTKESLARSRPRNPYPHLFRILHWLLTGSLVVLILTGWSLHAASRPEWSLFSGVLPSFFWPGRVHVIHLWAALVFFPSIIASVFLYWRCAVYRRATHYVLLTGGLATVAAGLCVLNPFGPPFVDSIARITLVTVGLVVMPVALLWHALVGFTKYWRMLVSAFHPWASPGLLAWVLFLPLPVITTCVVLNGLPVHRPWHELTARRIERVEDNPMPTPEDWDTATPLRIELANGAGFDRGRTQVKLWALHDGVELFILAEWEDPAEDRQDMPWKKIKGGWERLVTDPDDEMVHYEDKFSLIFATEPDWQFEQFGCAAQCHIGAGPLNRQKYGYKGSDTIIDVWHWKSTRSDPVGQVDDKYWSHLDFSPDNKDVGRHGDHLASGGYRKNESADKTRPSHLPGGPWVTKHGMIPEDRAIPYTPADAGGIEPGTVIAGIVASPFVGDRGDVKCHSIHEGDRWRLFIRRKLDTSVDHPEHAMHDVKFVPGETVTFGCAAFDHASKRHAYSLAVYRLTLEE